MTRPSLSRPGAQCKHCNHIRPFHAEEPLRACPECEEWSYLLVEQNPQLQKAQRGRKAEP